MQHGPAVSEELNFSKFHFQSLLVRSVYLWNKEWSSSSLSSNNIIAKNIYSLIMLLASTKTCFLYQIHEKTLLESWKSQAHLDFNIQANLS